MLPLPYAVEAGAGPRTIVFLHGFGACREIWRDVMAPLAAEARILAYDLPGHGHSL
ncbi:MAG: alpha/beta fold hydrolase, partial [Mesorhizobium sp.]